jgi:hypothetical protein
MGIEPAGPGIDRSATPASGTSSGGIAVENWRTVARNWSTE